jgi:anti-sigma factor RsiW
MEHIEAKQMHAAEKYVLGEMKGELREEFEEHYFDCAECALDVKAAAAFIAASKDIFQEEPGPVLVVTDEKPKAWGWHGWLKPLIAVPALAALVVMLAYEGHHLKSGLKEPTAPEQNLVASANFGLRGGDRVANENTVVRVHAGEAFGLHFDFTPTQSMEKYIGEVQDANGRAVMQVAIPTERINKEVKFVVPAGRLGAGNYVLVVYGTSGGEAGLGPGEKTGVASLPFSVEIVP